MINHPELEDIQQKHASELTRRDLWIIFYSAIAQGADVAKRLIEDGDDISFPWSFIKFTEPLDKLAKGFDTSDLIPYRIRFLTYKGEYLRASLFSYFIDLGLYIGVDRVRETEEDSEKTESEYKLEAEKLIELILCDTQ